MRMKLRLLNASSELLFSVDVGNLPETYGADSIKEGCPFISYQKLRTASWRTSLKGTKAHSDNSHLPTTFANWGLPKSECLKKLCVMRVNVINPKAAPREMTLKI